MAMLDRLIDLARAGTDDKRRELCLAVSDLFVDGVDRYSDAEVVLFGEVIAGLLAKVAAEDRIQVSRAVAPLARTPRGLALTLAEDEAPVAAPVLARSPALTDADLVRVVAEKGDAHRMAVAGRDGLAVAVTDALVDHGGDAVLVAVTRNGGARFSGRATAVLAERAVGDQRLAEAFAVRTDFPPALVERVVRLIPPAARRSLAAIAGTDGRVLDRVVVAARDEFDDARSVALRQRAEARTMVAEVQAGRLPIDEVLSRLVSGRRLLDIAYLLAELAEVPETHVANALQKPNATAIAVVCRHLEVGAPVYAALTRLRGERLCLAPAALDAMLAEYRDMTPGMADRALKFHQKRSAHRSIGA